MNKLEAKVTSIDSLENLTIVQFKFNGTTLSMMSLGLSNIKIGSKVFLNVNSSHIAIAKNLKGEISLSNQFECTIQKLTKGELLCSLILNYQGSLLTSIITTNSLIRMNLRQNDKIIALIKASDLSIQEIIE